MNQDKEFEYTLGPVRQIIDLNGSMVNFSATFQVISKSNKPFEYIVADQNEMENSPALNTAQDGAVSGTVSNNDGKQRTFYLILRSTEDNNDVTVQVHTTPLAAPAMVVPKPQVVSSLYTTQNDDKTTSWLKYLGIGVLLALAGYAYYTYVYKASSPETTKKVQSFNRPAFGFNNINRPNRPIPNTIRKPVVPQAVLDIHKRAAEQGVAAASPQNSGSYGSSDLYQKLGNLKIND